LNARLDESTSPRLDPSRLPSSDGGLSAKSNGISEQHLGKTLRQLSWLVAYKSRLVALPSLLADCSAIPMGGSCQCGARMFAIRMIVRCITEQRHVRDFVNTEEFRDALSRLQFG